MQTPVSKLEWFLQVLLTMVDKPDSTLADLAKK